MSEKTKTFTANVRLAVAMPHAGLSNASSISAFQSDRKNNFKSLKDFLFWNVLYVGTVIRDEVFGNRRAGIHVSASLTPYLVLSHCRLPFAAG